MIEQIRIGLIYGSTRPGRFCDTVAQWARNQIAGNPAFSLQPIDPANGNDPDSRQLCIRCMRRLRRRHARVQPRLLPLR